MITLFPMDKNMSTSTNSQTKYNRRKFLKNAGSLGSIAAGATFSTSVLADNYPQPKTVDANCEFSQLDPEFTYLNSGTEGSMPRCVLDELSNKQNQWASNPTASYETDKILGKHQHQNRESIAQLLATEKNNICLTDNTTMGLSMVLMGIKFEQESGGAGAVEKHIIDLSNQVKHMILTRAPEAIVSPSSDNQLLSGLTVFFPFNWDKPEQLFKDKKTADKVVKELSKKNIQIRSIGLVDSKQSDEKSYVLRVSTAIFNTKQQIERFKLALKEVLSKL